MVPNRIYLLCIIAGLLVWMQVMEANGQDDLMVDIMAKSYNGDECPFNLDDIDDGVDPIKRSLQEDHEGPLKLMGHITVVGH